AGASRIRTRGPTLINLLHSDCYRASRQAVQMTGSGVQRLGPADLARPGSGGQGYPEGLREPGTPLGGDRQRAGVAQAGNSAQLEAAPGQRRADRARQMRTAFARVEAGAAESSFPVTG